MTESTISGELADWIAGLSLADIPEMAREAVENTVIDTVALTSAALDTDYGRAVRQAFDARGDCTVWGVEKQIDLAGAAMINGTCGHGEDYDNTFEGCPVHSGVVVVPALFAAGEFLELAKADVAKRAGGRHRGREPARHGRGQGRTCRGLSPDRDPRHHGRCRRRRRGDGPDAGLRYRTRSASPARWRPASSNISPMAAGPSACMPAGPRNPASARRRWAPRAFVGPKTVFEGVHGLYAAFAPSIKPDFYTAHPGLSARPGRRRMSRSSPMPAEP